MGGWRRRAEEAEGRLQAMEEEREKEKAEVERKLGAIVGAITEEARRWEEEARRWQEEARRWGEEAAGQLIHVAKEAGWQPIVYSKTAARLFKAAWCLLRIATPYPVLRRLRAGRGPRGGTDLFDQPLSVLLLRHIHFFLRVFPNYHIFFSNPCIFLK